MSALVGLRGLEVQRGALHIGPLDVEVPAGGVLGVIGPSGSGKSTLLDVVAGLMLPSAGTVCIGGSVASSPVASVPPHRRGVAYLMQETGLWTRLTAKENVARVVKVHGSRLDADAWLDEVGARHLAGHRAGSLSGGEARRVGIARVLACEPDVLLLDEPMAALDDEAGRALTALIRRETGSRGTSVIVSGHGPESVAPFDPEAEIDLGERRDPV